MKSYNFKYDNYENLKGFININGIDKGNNILKNDESDFHQERTIGSKLISKDTKSILSFISMEVDGQEFLDGINDVNLNIIVAGGVAGNSNLENNTYVFTKV